MVAQNTHAQPRQQFYNTRTGHIAVFNDRALQLAEAHGINGTGRGVALVYTADGQTPARVTVRVASQSQTDVIYDVVYTVASDRALCRCTAAAFGRPCAHAGVAIEYGRYVAELHSPRARAEAARMATLDWRAEAAVPSVAGLAGLADDGMWR